MIRPRSVLFAALGLTAVVATSAVVPTAAGAIDQDLVVSAAAGPPGTQITVSSASCTSTDDLDALLEVKLIVGTAPDEQLAGIGQSGTGTAVVPVPDWLDPDQPAVIEASCSIYDLATDAFEDLTYDPVAFDVEPGSNPPVQVRSLSRTDLQSGQGFVVDGSCGPGLGGSLVVVTVLEGTDQSGRDVLPSVAWAYVEADADGTFEAPVIVNNAAVYVGFDGEDATTIDELSIAEESLQLEAGPYTVLTRCMSLVPGSPSQLVLEPAAITLTGAAPTGQVELLADSQVPRDVVMAGECGDEVTGWLEGLSLADLNDRYGDPDDEAAVRAGRFPTLTDGRAGGRGVEVRAGLRAGAGPERLVASEEETAFTTVAEDDGIWRHQDTTDFDQGVVIGQARCGDPFADGYQYDPQGVVVDATETTTTTTVPQLVPPTVPASPPANAVPGTPTYAG